MIRKATKYAGDPRLLRVRKDAPHQSL